MQLSLELYSINYKYHIKFFLPGLFIIDSPNEINSMASFNLSGDHWWCILKWFAHNVASGNSKTSLESFASLYFTGELWFFLIVHFFRTMDPLLRAFDSVPCVIFKALLAALIEGNSDTAYIFNYNLYSCFPSCFATKYIFTIKRCL